jgi:hypothetical protein
MTHDQIVAALQRDYQLDDARVSRRGCYPIRKPAPRSSPRPANHQWKTNEIDVDSRSPRSSPTTPGR